MKYLASVEGRFDPDLLDDGAPFEIDAQAAHLFKHPHLGLEDSYDVWTSDPLLYPRDGFWWCLLSQPATVIRANVDRSADTRLPSRSPRSSGATDDHASDTPGEEYDFYAQPENQVPQSKPRRRRAALSAPVPVRFPPDLLEEIRRRADADDRSVPSWIRRAVEDELDRPA